MTCLRYACCLLLLALTSWAVSAQKTTISPLTVGFDIGFALNNSSSSFRTSTSTQVVQLRAGYRFKRWLGLGVSLGYTGIADMGDFFIKDDVNFFTNTGEPWTSSAKTHQFPLVVGPELSMRIGQGDLSVAAQFGFIFHRSKAFLVNPTEEYTLYYSPAIDNYNIFSIAYTYWPKEHFGINIGLQAQSSISGNPLNPGVTSGTLQQYPELTLDVLERGIAPTSIFDLRLFKFGITYRL